MARSHTLASFRPAGFALLRPASRPRLDTARIITLSGTIAVNTLAFGLLMMPLTLPAPLPLPDEKPVIPLEDWIRRKQPEPEPVEIVKDVKPTPPKSTPTEQRSVSPRQSDAVPMEAIAETGTELATVATSEEIGPVESLTSISVAPSPVQLEYRSAPAPTYPRMAMKRGITGTVLLKVLVGIDGRPLEVTVAQSSGNRELDEAARAQVLRRWSFQPATKDGRAVQAIGMVPIEFALR
jgi:periplasmic protein TonB